MHKKITDKTRVKLNSTRLFKFLDLRFWASDRNAIIYKYMYDNFNMRCTSRRLGTYYFSIGDKAKYSLFLLKHNDLLQGP